jgi:hypothetical protein
MAVEWTTQSDEGHQADAYGNGHDTQPLPPQPPLPPQAQPPLAPQPHPPLPEESVTPPVTSPPPPVPTHAAPMPSATPQSPSGFEHCPSCGALVAADQRYCLECGHRRGEPRLPFMDAVVFMDAMNQPPAAASASPKKKKKGISPNAALIAGIGTLLLALGIGVLIGRSGDHSAAPASQAPIVIKGGGGEEVASTGAETTGGGTSTKGKSKKQIVKAKKQAAESGEGAASVLHYSSKAKPPAKPTAQLGEKCAKGTAGCAANGKFEGSFFGGE